MGREYNIIVETREGLRRLDPGPEFHCNVWMCSQYGYIFQKLGLPVGPRSHMLAAIGFPDFLHEYKGEDLQAVRKLVSLASFRGQLIEAIQYADKEMGYTPETCILGKDYFLSAEAQADEMLREVFPLFQDPRAVAIASDYCEEYESISEKTYVHR